ncbi:MAG: aldehyde dehydrogenase family protein [Planctomycetota bacterium]|jgi:acyl-CoA reductase-like NAD-dependent aldehyde dehydrogenase
MRGAPPSSDSSDPQDALDRGLEDLAHCARSWPRVGVDERRRLLAAVRGEVAACAADWARAGCDAKGLSADGPQAAEEWLTGPVQVLRNLRLLEQTLARLAAGRDPVDPEDLVQDGERVRVPVVPNGLQERVMLPGMSAEVWCGGPAAPDGGLDPARVARDAAWIYRERPAETGICGVLGAGNVSSIGPMDCLTKLFVEGHSVLLKHHPVNAYLEPIFARALRPLIERGFLRQVTGGAEVGQALVHDERVTDLHITGSGAVHDAIVWGTGAEQAERKAAGDPLVSKPISSELGCVTPILILPGPWSAQDLRRVARSVATMVANNASFNCNSAKLLITSEAWEQRFAFLEELRQALAAIPTRLAYYPGAHERHERYCEAALEPGTGNLERLGKPSPNHLPWALATGLDPQRADRTPFQEEPWCAVLGEVVLPEGGSEFAGAAAAFANEQLFGTLSAGLWVHPDTEAADPGVTERVLRALRYGDIAVNEWPGLAYGLVAPSWGAYPGHTLADVGSGRGVVHNTCALDHVEKSVVRAPFRHPITPIWNSFHRRALPAARGLTRYEAKPGWLRLAALGVSAYRP